MERDCTHKFGRSVVFATLIAISALSFAAGANAQSRNLGTPLTNADIVRMVKGGKSDAEVIAAIRSGNAKFDISEKKLLEMHNEGVSADVLHAIFVKGGGAVVGEQELKTQLAKAPLKLQISKQVASNPHLANAHAAILAVLQKQRDAASAEIAQTKLRLQTKAQTGPLGGAPRPANNSATTSQSQNSRVALAQKPAVQKPATTEAIGPERTSSAMINPSGTSGLLAQGGNTAGNAASGSTGKNGNIPSRMIYAPGPVENTALICAQDPTMRILSVSGSSSAATFTPVDQYNLYTIRGCSFGNQAPTNDTGPTDWVHIYGGVGSFYGKFAIKFWSDDEIEVSLDESLSGFLDLNNLNLVVKRADGQQAQREGFKFYAARQTVPLLSIPQSWAKLTVLPEIGAGHDAMALFYSSPPASASAASYPVPAIPPPGPSAGSAYVSRSFNGGKFAASGRFDLYDLGHLAPGWNPDSFGVTPYEQACPADYGWVNTYKQSFGNWGGGWQGNYILVQLSITSCSGFYGPCVVAPWTCQNYQNWSGSYYALQVWVTGPRGTDPITGLPTK